MPQSVRHPTQPRLELLLHYLFEYVWTIDAIVKAKVVRDEWLSAELSSDLIQFPRLISKLFQEVSVTSQSGPSTHQRFSRLQELADHKRWVRESLKRIVVTGQKCFGNEGKNHRRDPDWGLFTEKLASEIQSVTKRIVGFSRRPDSILWEHHAEARTELPILATPGCKVGLIAAIDDLYRNAQISIGAIAVLSTLERVFDMPFARDLYLIDMTVNSTKPKWVEPHPKYRKIVRISLDSIQQIREALVGLATANFGSAFKNRDVTALFD
ncbi:hypothetical protein SCOR_34025 [Sulfidibacter corallicola]|uniref:Uncharacterized protein n=1 Tax=Sulfidibacter corallicola TaxID=2818388 RepID=A0A8A4TSC1_SULCO|nr:hypothetical protein [Sulfidibacter corallicola]QTD49445.1 hypothetical protein J3U87_27990 [Sulfidibacter corallicola]